jgi:hypothetical protein
MSMPYRQKSNKNNAVRYYVARYVIRFVIRSGREQTSSVGDRVTVLYQPFAFGFKAFQGRQEPRQVVLDHATGRGPDGALQALGCHFVGHFTHFQYERAAMRLPPSSSTKYVVVQWGPVYIFGLKTYQTNGLN